MIEIRKGSHISKLLYMLTVAGEFPVYSISLLGRYKTYNEILAKATKPCEYLNLETKERYITRLLRISGKGSQKTVRLLTGAEKILEWLGLWKLYQSLHGTMHYRGDVSHISRAHRIAEGLAMAYRAGLETNVLEMPMLQLNQITNSFENKQCFYMSKQLKGVERIEMNKHAYTRIIGALFSGGNAYAVYNTRNQTMKWCGNGEKKAQVNLEEVSRMNAGVHRVTSAILFGENADIALKTLVQAKKTKRLEHHFDSIYFHIHFIPLDENGIRLLRLISRENWRENLLSVLFSDETRSYDKEMFEYDAKINGKYILTFFDGDIARLLRFQYVASRMDGEFEVLCFPFQGGFVKELLGDLAKIKTAKWEVIENAMEIGG